MPLSADNRAVFVQSTTMPEMLTPALGKNAADEADELKELYPEFIEGKRQVIPDFDRKNYEYWQAMATYADNQKKLARNRVRLELGDAEYGTDSKGNVFVSRRMGWSDGYNVLPGPTDSIYPERG